MQIGLSFLEKYADHALLFLRIGLGSLVCYHGVPLFLGGPGQWKELGETAALVGLTSLPVFWGFMAATSQFFGGLFTVVGLGTRIWALLIGATMAMAAFSHLRGGDGLTGAAHALALAVVFCALIVLGPGRFSIDARLS